MDNLIEAGQIMIKGKSVPIDIFAGGDYKVILYHKECNYLGLRFLLYVEELQRLHP